MLSGLQARPAASASRGSLALNTFLVWQRVETPLVKAFENRAPSLLKACQIVARQTGLSAKAVEHSAFPGSERSAARFSPTPVQTPTSVRVFECCSAKRRLRRSHFCDVALSAALPKQSLRGLSAPEQRLGRSATRRSLGRSRLGFHCQGSSQRVEAREDRRRSGSLGEGRAEGSVQ